MTTQAIALSRKEKAALKAAEKLAAKLKAAEAENVDPVLGMTAAQAQAILVVRAQKRSEAAKKAHATRSANGTSSDAAKKAWQTRREYEARLQALAAKA